MSNIFVNNIRALRWLPAICFAWVSSGCANTGVPCPQIDASAGVFSSAVFEDGVVAFEQSSSKRLPIDVVLYRGEESCRRLVIDKYDYAGGRPAVRHVFPFTVKDETNLFVIVSWDINSPGAGVKGTLYDVYAYKDDGDGSLTVKESIVHDSRIHGGIEGMDNYRDSHFAGKTPEGVKRLVREAGL